jgi:hypothetical protein
LASGSGETSSGEQHPGISDFGHHLSCVPYPGGRALVFPRKARSASADEEEQTDSEGRAGAYELPGPEAQVRNPELAQFSGKRLV